MPQNGHDPASGQPACPKSRAYLPDGQARGPNHCSSAATRQLADLTAALDDDRARHGLRCQVPSVTWTSIGLDEPGVDGLGTGGPSSASLFCSVHVISSSSLTTIECLGSAARCCEH